MWRVWTMKNHFYSLLMAIALVIALMLPGQAAKAAEAAPDTPVYVDGDENVTTPDDEVIPASDEAQPAPRSYGLRRDAFNGTINVLYQTPDEYGWYYIPEGTQVSFSIMPNEGFYQADHINFVVADGEIEIPNPSLTYRDENNNFQYIVPSYDNTTGWYTFTMPAYETFINAMFYPMQDTPVDPVVETETLYGIYPNAFRGTITIVEQTLNENGIYAVPEGTAVSFYVVPDEGCYLADNVIFLQEDESELAMPNPVVYYYDENGATQYIVPTYDGTTAWYTFTMPAADAFIDATFLTVEDTPVDDPVSEPLYNVDGYGYNGEITIVEQIPNEYGYYFVPEGTEISFYGTTEEGFVPTDSTTFNTDDGFFTLSNPVVTYRDENGTFCYIVPSYDDNTGWYTFTMPAADALIYMDFLPVENTPEDLYYVNPVPYCGQVTIVEQVQDENGFYRLPEGTDVSFYVTPDEDCYQAEQIHFTLGDDEELSLPNPIVTYLDESGDFRYIIPSYDDNTGWYTFTMPGRDVSIHVDCYPNEDSPVYETIHDIYPDAFNGEITIIEQTADENGWYHTSEGTEISFYVMPDEGFYQADSIIFLEDDESEIARPNPLAYYYDANSDCQYIVPSYDETTGWYSFTMPAADVFLMVSFLEIPAPEPEHFIGRVPSEGGSIEFVPENPYCSANEGDIVTVEVTADQGYKLDSFYVMNCRTLEDGSVEYIDDSYVDFTKNADGTYSFVMPDNPVQIFAIFNKTSNSGSTGHGYGWGCGFGNGWSWGFGHNYGHGNNWGYGHGIGYGYGYGNSYGHGYGHGYGYGNSCHSLIGGIVGFLSSCNPWSLFR